LGTREYHHLIVPVRDKGSVLSKSCVGKSKNLQRVGKGAHSPEYLAFLRILSLQSTRLLEPTLQSLRDGV